MKVFLIHKDRIAVGIIIAMMILCAFVVNDYGITWDETIQHEYGERVLAFYTSGFSDHRALSFGNLYYYGGLLEVLFVLVAKIVPADIFLIRHCITALIGIVGLVGVYELGRRLGGRATAIIAMLVLALSPLYLAELFNNSKDLPFAVGYIWAVVFLIDFGKSLPNPSLAVSLRFGIAAGLTMAFRVGGMLLYFYFGLVLLVFLWRQRLNLISKHSFWVRFGKPLLQVAAIIFISSYALMIIAWPWALVEPWRPFEALSKMVRFASGPSEILLMGQWVPTKSLPLTYIPVYATIKIPELVLMALAIGFLKIIVAIFTKRLAQLKPTMEQALVILAAIFPLVYVIVQHSKLYDGLRHLLFAMSVLMVVAAWQIIWFFKRFILGNKTRYYISILLVVLYLAAHLSIIIRLHPYHMIYYNVIAKGPSHAVGRFVGDSAGLSYREAVMLLSSHLLADNPPNEQQPVRVHACSNPVSSTWFFPLWMKWAQNISDADYVLSTTACPCERSLVGKGKEILAVERLGAKINIVRSMH
ncbi:MAG: glycosyltransferase family 39 protein [Deltaproteobacteria bacterium]|nr:glycosyltransferase family 39 protein [Deltaproteobacteria bacterium]